MHIPDGYLSPATCALFYVVDVPIWTRAGRAVRKVVKSRNVPLLAIGAAYCFLTMMFNVPIPDGTTAHAVGAVLVAVMLGPWAAIIAVSIALAVQALFFGDGGVLAYGANVFNMAVVMSLVGYVVYRLGSRGVSLTSPRRAVAAGLGGYIGLNAAALCTAVEFGLQPTLFHRADGTPLYAPFHLTQAIPAMMLAHLFVAGAVEFVLTAGIVAYLQRANLPLLRINHGAVAETDDGDPVDTESKPFRWRSGLLPLIVMGALTPLGLLAPGSAFGEARPSNLNLKKYHLNAVPSGLRRYAGLWHSAIFRGYDFSHDKHPAVGYLISAAVGIAVIAAVIVVIFIAMRYLHRRRTTEQPERDRVASAASSTATPQWLLQNEVGLCPCGCVGKRSKGSFLERTIAGSVNVMRQALFADDVAGRDGLLQRIEPRVKLISMLVLLIAAALVRNIPALIGLYLITLILAVSSKVSLGFFIKRVWLFIPIFTGLVVLPATLSIVTHGRIVVPLGHWWFGHRIGLTRQGLNAAGLIVSRVAVSISLVVLLTLTTPWNRLLAALRAFRLPRVFVLVLAMCYRYIFHLLGAVSDMYTARKARSAGRDNDIRAGRAFVAATAGALFGKANALSEEVHQAMVSRGYTGSVRTLSERRARAMDVAWLMCCVALTFIVVGGDRVIGR